MQDLSSWAQYLEHPLVLIGFVVFLFSGISHALLKIKKSSSNELLKKWLRYFFILSIIAIISGFVIAYKEKAQSSRHIEQKTEGTQSPAVVSGGDVTIKFESGKE